MSKSHDKAELLGGKAYLKKVAIVWAICLALAALALGALQYYRDDLITRLAYGELGAARRAEFLHDQADADFLAVMEDVTEGRSDFEGDERLERAIGYYRQVLALRGRPESEEIYEKLGTLYDLQGDAERTAEMRAQAFILNDQPQGAIDALRDTEDRANLHLLGLAYLEAGDPQAGIAVAERLEAETGVEDHYAPLLRAGVASSAAQKSEIAGDIERAVELRKETVGHLKEVLLSRPTDLEIFFGIADNYTILARLSDDSSFLKQGQAFLVRASEVSPPDAMLYHKLGINLLQQEEAAEAAKWLEKAIDIRRTAARLHFDLWRAYSLTGDAFQASEALKRSLALDPEATNRWLKAHQE